MKIDNKFQQAQFQGQKAMSTAPRFAATQLPGLVTAPHRDEVKFGDLKDIKDRAKKALIEEEGQAEPKADTPEAPATPSAPAAGDALKDSGINLNINIGPQDPAAPAPATPAPATPAPAAPVQPEAPAPEIQKELPEQIIDSLLKEQEKLIDMHKKNLEVLVQIYKQFYKEDNRFTQQAEKFAEDKKAVMKLHELIQKKDAEGSISASKMEAFKRRLDEMVHNLQKNKKALESQQKRTEKAKDVKVKADERCTNHEEALKDMKFRIEGAINDIEQARMNNSLAELNETISSIRGQSIATSDLAKSLEAASDFMLESQAKLDVSERHDVGGEAQDVQAELNKELRRERTTEFLEELFAEEAEAEAEEDTQTKTSSNSGNN